MIYFNGLNEPSRLKGIETNGDVLFDLTSVSIRLNEPSRLKGIETSTSILSPGAYCPRLNEPSRLKGIETICQDFCLFVLCFLSE